MMSPRPQRVSRDDVLVAARDLLDAEGLDALTMRRLGAALGADPMTAYRHFAGKTELASALADEFWISLTLPDVDGVGDWKGYAARLMRGIRSALADHPGIIPIVATHPIDSPAALTVADEAIGRLLDSGAPINPSLGDLVNVLVMLTVASALGEYSEPVGSDAGASQPNVSDESEALAALPHLGKIVASGWAPSPERQFESGLAAVLDGWRFHAQ